MSKPNIMRVKKNPAFVAELMKRVKAAQEAADMETLKFLAMIDHNMDELISIVEVTIPALDLTSKALTSAMAAQQFMMLDWQKLVSDQGAEVPIWSDDVQEAMKQTIELIKARDLIMLKSI